MVSDGGLKPETLARRKRVRAAFQAFTVQHYEKDVTELINGPKEDLSKAVCAFLSTLCVNKRQSDLKMAQVLPKQNTLDYYKTNLKATILIESDGQLDITNKAQFNQVVMCLKGLAKKLKNHGKGDTQHHEEIDQESLKKIYKLGANVLAVLEARSRNSCDQ